MNHDPVGVRNPTGPDKETEDMGKTEKTDYGIDYRSRPPEGMRYFMPPWMNGKLYLSRSDGADWDATRGEFVQHIQEELISAGFLDVPTPGTPVETEREYGIYGPWTMMGVVRYQGRLGLSSSLAQSDGNLGRPTCGAHQRQSGGKSLPNMTFDHMVPADHKDSIQGRYLAPDGVVRDWPPKENK